MGERPYRGVFSLIALASIALIGSEPSIGKIHRPIPARPNLYAERLPSAGVLDMWPDTGGRIASDVVVNPVTM